jgi:hypothetical protein
MALTGIATWLFGPWVAFWSVFLLVVAALVWPEGKPTSSRLAAWQAEGERLWRGKRRRD